MCFRKPKPELSKRPIRIKIQIIIWQWELKMKTSRLLGARENAATQSRLYFSFCIWLVERMARVSWTNHKTTFGNTKTLKSGRITFDTQLKIGPKMIMSIRAIYNFLLSVEFSSWCFPSFRLAVVISLASSGCTTRDQK